MAARVVELATSTYAGFNRQHLTEMLAEHHGIVLSRPTVHRILATAGVAPIRHRRPARHRQRRDRYPREGMLLQVDGSRHDWLEGRGPYLTLIGGIDDATGLVPWACFREQEDSQGYFQLFREVVRRRGIPMAVYSDQHSIFYSVKKAPTLEEQLTGRRTPTQVGRLLEELGTRWIRARSPQAKGRVERLWGTFQDRLTSELRLAGASTQEEASVVLERYLARHNRRFTVPPADPTPALAALAQGKVSPRRLLLQVPAPRRQRQHRPAWSSRHGHPSQPTADQLRPLPRRPPSALRRNPPRLPQRHPARLRLSTPLSPAQHTKPSVWPRPLRSGAPAGSRSALSCPLLRPTLEASPQPSLAPVNRPESRNC